MKYTETEIGEVAKKVLEEVLLRPDPGRGAALVLLSGDLGAGKTTLVQAIARELGINQTVQSPTFVIMRSYEISADAYPWKKMIHMDAYRLEGSKDLEPLRLEEFLSGPDNLVIIEWPERVPEIAKTPHILCSLKHTSDIEREIAIGV